MQSATLLSMLAPTDIFFDLDFAFLLIYLHIFDPDAIWVVQEVFEMNFLVSSRNENLLAGH